MRGVDGALSRAENKINFRTRKGRLKISQGDKAADEDDTEEVVVVVTVT